MSKNTGDAFLKGEGIDPEAELQRKLAKKLGLKEGKSSKISGDGLDELLQELDDVMGGDIGSDSEEEDKEQQSFGLTSSDSMGDDVSLTEGDDSLDMLDSDTDDSIGDDYEGSEAVLLQEEEFENNASRLFDDIQGDSTSEEEEEEGDGTSRDDFTNEDEGGEGKRQKHEEDSRKAAGVSSTNGQKYVPPALRKLAVSQATTPGDEEAMAVHKRVRGLINRIAETNMQAIVRHVFLLDAVVYSKI